jgi:hypothetical protein
MVRMVDGRKIVAMLCAIAGLSIVIQLSFDHASINLQKPTLSDLTKLWTSATSGTLAAGLFYALFTSWLWKLPLLHDWLVVLDRASVRSTDLHRRISGIDEPCIDRDARQK